MELVWPGEAYLDSYREALERGWGPNTLRMTESAQEELASIDRDPVSFLALKVDREARGGPILLPDGTQARRLPGYCLWAWEGAFCGWIGFRWQPGTPELPPHVLGHIGYSVVPWKRRQGYATRMLAGMIEEVRKEGLPYVELTTDVDNIPSQKVILANGGTLVEPFTKLAVHGGGEGLRFRIPLA